MSFLNDVIQIFVKYHTQLLQGVGNTMLIALTATAAGLVIGLLTGVVRTAPLPPRKGGARFAGRRADGEPRRTHRNGRRRARRAYV